MRVNEVDLPFGKKGYEVEIYCGDDLRHFMFPAEAVPGARTNDDFTDEKVRLLVEWGSRQIRKTWDLHEDMTDVVLVSKKNSPIPD